MSRTAAVNHLLLSHLQTTLKTHAMIKPLLQKICTTVHSVQTYTQRSIELHKHSQSHWLTCSNGAAACWLNCNRLLNIFIAHRCRRADQQHTGAQARHQCCQLPAVLTGRAGLVSRQRPQHSSMGCTSTESHFIWFCTTTHLPGSLQGTHRFC